MKLNNIPLPPEIIKKIISIESFSSLFPPQVEAIEAGLFNNENMLFAIPTASGKTFIAELCALQHILVLNSRVLYLSPLRALATEKYYDFKRFESLGIKIGVTTGDFDSPDLHLKKFDFIVSTNEKIDSLLRHDLQILNDVSLLIVDECHLLDDPHRGPTLETLLVKIKILKPKLQILALSATVKNTEEIATWLEATLIESSWRPVPLEEAYCTAKGKLHYRSGISRLLQIKNTKEIPIILVDETLSEGGQALLFAPSRISAQKFATILAPSVSRHLKKKKLMNWK